MANPPTDYYVDPSIAGNSGAGTVGDPYGDLQYALDTITQDTTDGDRINVKAGTAEILTAALSLTTYGTPNYAYPLIFQGYTTSQGDGGIGAIDCQTFTAITNAGNGISWFDMEVYDGPSTGSLITLLGFSSIAGCYIHDSDGHGLTVSGDYSAVVGNRFEDLGSSGYHMLGVNNNVDGPIINGNYFKQGASRTCDHAAKIQGPYTAFTANIISIDSTSDGVDFTKYGCYVDGNTILSSSGTGIGINLSSTFDMCNHVVNNYIEGFSGAGGVGLSNASSSNGSGVFGQNAYYNNTTDQTQNCELNYELGDNETLGATGLTKSGSDTYANRFTYFEPVDTGNMVSGGFPEA